MPGEADAVEAAVRAVRRFEREGWAHGRGSPADALEAVLGPLDWSFDGRGFRLLRQVAARVLPAREPPAPKRRLDGERYYAATDAARASAHRLLARVER